MTIYIEDPTPPEAAQRWADQKIQEMLDKIPDLRATHAGREFRDVKIPMQRAIEKVAEQMNLPPEKVAEYARRMQAGKLQIGTPMTSGRSAYSVGLGTALAIAAQHERNRALSRGIAPADPELSVEEFRESMRKSLASVSFASERIQRLHGVRPIFGPGKCPANPKDRRTVRIAGKPKHYVQHGDELVLKDGESPWT